MHLLLVGVTRGSYPFLFGCGSASLVAGSIAQLSILSSRVNLSILVWANDFYDTDASHDTRRQCRTCHARIAAT